MTIAALTLVALQTGDPIERNAAFMASAKGLSVEFTVTAPYITGQAQCTLKIQRPNMQVFTSKWGTEAFRFFASPAGTLSIRDDWRQYEESPPVPRLVPPPEIGGISELTYPLFLVLSSLKVFDPEAPREALGQETVRGSVCDRVRIVSDSPVFGGTHSFWIDARGRVLRWRREIKTDSGNLDTTMEFTKVEPSAPTEPAHYQGQLPLGYMPASVPTSRANVRMTSQEAVFGKWRDARRGTVVDVAALAKGKPVAIVFTDPDCAISASAEPYLSSLRRALKPKGCALIEVSLGSKKPDSARKDKDRQLFWDQDGAIEAVYGVPGTPYFLLVDAKGVIARGWQGYTKATEPEITKTLLGAF
jgi:hypothetical protein